LNHIANVIAELEGQVKVIDRALAELRGLGAGKAHRGASFVTTNHKARRLSALGRRKISEAAKKRWAAVRAAKEGAAMKKSAPVMKKAKKRVLSAEARKKMAEAAKKRWAAQKKKAA
jgi:hypothetical protein